LGANARGLTHYGAVSEIAGPVERVVIVGAGIAGLAAATQLTKAGIACMVLDARDRIGGRLHTIDLAGAAVDLGGSWIHHPIGNPMSALGDELGVARDAGDPTPTLTAYDLAEGRRLDHAETQRYSQVECAAFWDAVDAIGSFVAARGLTGGEARRVRQALRSQVEADAGDRADNASLRWMTFGQEFEGSDLGDLPGPVEHRSRLHCDRWRWHPGRLRGRIGRDGLARGRHRSTRCSGATTTSLI
jgi:hypothetical protein